MWNGFFFVFFHPLSCESSTCKLVWINSLIFVSSSLESSFFCPLTWDVLSNLALWISCWNQQLSCSLLLIINFLPFGMLWTLAMIGIVWRFQHTKKEVQTMLDLNKSLSSTKSHVGTLSCRKMAQNFTANEKMMTATSVYNLITMIICF